MKSLVALLDRKKRPNTFVPAPLPSPSSTVSAYQERPAPPLSIRHTLSSDVLRPPPSHRATSNPNLVRRPHLHESALHPRTQSPVQSIAYHNDPDDDTLFDPFAATSPKHALLPTLFRPVSTPARRASNLNLATSAPQDVFQNPQPIRNTRDERNSNRALPTPVVSTKPVPQLPPFPAIPERKSSFFRRARSGSTPAATSGAERTHTSHPLPTASAQVPVQLRVPAASQFRSVNKETTRPVPTATPESWARAGGVGRDQCSSSSPTNTRRRALSAPARPPEPTELVPPVPVLQLVPSVSLSELNTSKMTSGQVSPGFRPEVPGDRQIRPPCGAHAPKSGSAPVSSSHDPGCAPLASNLRRRPSVKHIKQLSISVSEGGHGTDSASSTGRIVRKSALRRTSAQVRHDSHTRAAAAEGPVIGTTSVSQPPTPHQGVSDLFPKTDAAEHRHPVGGIIQTAPLAARAKDTSAGGPGTPPSVTNAGSIPGGHSLAPSDSRTLPVLDNVWGSFVSETAFGSLPSSPSGSITVANRVANLPSPVPRRQTAECPSSPENPRGLSHRRQWRSALPPPCSPPVVKLPPIPTEESQAVALSFGSVIRRKLSRCPSKREMVLTPPISPPEETEIQGLGVTPSTSTSGNSLLASSCNSSSASSMGSRDLPPLMRNPSSPIMRSPASPALDAASDTSDRSWLPVDPPRLRSISSSSTSRSGSQCTPVPGTPIASPISGLTYFGASSGVSDSALSTSSSEGAHVGIFDESARKDGLRLSPPSVPVEGSEISLSMFPAVPMGIPGPYGRREMNGNVECGETFLTNWSEESLLTPPITPAWFAQTFHTSSGNERECANVGETGKIPLTHVGNLARIRRKRAQNTPSSSSNEGSSDGTWGLAYLHRPLEN